MTIYPDAIDGYSQLPIFVDGITPIDAEGINNLRSSIVAIENELGTNPAGEYSTVRSRLDSLGGTAVQVATTNITMDGIYNVILVNATSGAKTITLPLAAEFFGPFHIKKIDTTSNLVTILPQNAEVVDGEEGIIITYAYDSYSVVSDGTNWFII